MTEERKSSDQPDFDDMEGFLAERLDVKNPGSGQWAACMQFVEAYKKAAVRRALEEAARGVEAETGHKGSAYKSVHNLIDALNKGEWEP